MTTGPSPDYTSRQLQLALEALDAARFLLGDGRLKAAVNRAYYVMFHAAHAALGTQAVRLPKTHSGTIDLFNRTVRPLWPRGAFPRGRPPARRRPEASERL